MNKALCIIFISLFAAASNSCIKNKTFPMKVIFIQGTAYLKSDNSKKIIEVDQFINEGETIITENKSMVNVLLNNVSVIKIAENTILELSKINKNSNDELQDTLCSLQEGKIFAIFHKILKGSTATVKTPSAVMAVRGTAFSVSLYKENQKGVTLLQVTDGKVEIKTQAKPEITETLVRGEDVIFGEEKIIREKSSITADSAEELNREFNQLRETIENRKSETSDFEELKKSVQVIKPLESEKETKTPPVFKTEEEIRNYYKRLERVKLDDGSIFVGAIINQDSKNIKINTVNGIITVPVKSVIESKMIYK